MGLETATVFTELVVTNPVFTDVRSQGDDHIRMLKTVITNLGKLHKGPTAPASPVAGMLWLEDDNPSSTVWTLHLFDAAQWIDLIQIDSTNNRILYVSPMLLTSDGSAGNPAFAFSSDPDTGIYLFGADQLRFVTGGVDFLRADASQQVLFPSQPSFLATNGTQNANVTGNGTLYSPANFDTEIFDQNADFASSTFTAPKTGIYILGVVAHIEGITSAAGQVELVISTSNRSYEVFRGNAANVRVNNQIRVCGTVVADMDAGDTAIIQLTVSGEASDVIDWGTGSRFFGWLLG